MRAIFLLCRGIQQQLATLSGREPSLSAIVEREAPKRGDFGVARSWRSKARSLAQALALATTLLYPQVKAALPNRLVTDL